MDVSLPDEMYIQFREYENINEDAPKVTKLKRPTEKFSQIVGAQLKASLLKRTDRNTIETDRKSMGIYRFVTGLSG